MTRIPRPGLSALILAGVLVGMATGLLFGEHVAFLSLAGDIFVGLLQMTVLPYITLALISNIGRLSSKEGRRFGFYAGTFLLLSTALCLGAILLLPLSLPHMESASFFSTGSLQEPAEVDFLSLFIPSNPFHALANNVVPAVVIFCIAVGLAIMSLTQKQAVLDQLDVVTVAFARINQSLVKVTPVGVFAIVASTAGTMQLAELARLEAYLLLFLAGVLILGFGVMVPLLSALTPFSMGQILRALRAPMLTAFATGKVFIVLPMLVAAAEELFRERGGDFERPVSTARAVTPLIYPFPHAGKLLALLFVPFAAWFVDQPVSVAQYPLLLGTGLFSMFGSPLAAIPFLLDQLRLPADMFQLFVVSGVLASRMGDLLGAIHLFFVSVLTACALTGMLRVQVRRLIPVVVVGILVGAAVTGATRGFLSQSLDGAFDKDAAIRNMHSSLHSSAETVVHRSVPLSPVTSGVHGLGRIERTGVLRVGYHPNNLPASFFNAEDELVGYDVDMAYLLAQHLQCRLEFVPFEFHSLPAQLERGDFDLAMSAVTMLPARLAKMRFTEPYMQITAALLVPDHRREEFDERMNSRRFGDLTIAVGRTSDAAPIARSLLPGAEVVTLPSVREYLESGGVEADAMLWTAEAGAAWTLLFPEFSVVLIRPLFQAPVGYPVARSNEAFAQFLSSWIQFVGAGAYDQRLYDHWILGKTAKKSGPRWSVLRDVLGWID